MLNAIIIDDERRGRESLRYLIEENAHDIKVVDVADGVKSGIAVIELHNPDLVFLDIKMKKGTGFDLLNQIETPNFQVIFTTAFNEYAIKAFKFNALDYLLKPIDSEDLVKSIDKAKKLKDLTHRSELNKLMIDNIAHFNNKDPKIAVASEESFIFVKVSQILRIEADGAYSKLTLSSGKTYLTSRLLKEYESILKEHSFYRVHHSHLVNVNEMERYSKKEGGSIIMSNGDIIPVSRRKKDYFLKEYVKKFLH